MLASRLPSIMPAMTEAEALAVASVQSVAGRKMGTGIGHWSERPISISAPYLFRSGLLLEAVPFLNREKPLWRIVVFLFLDELPEFDRKV